MKIIIETRLKKLPRCCGNCKYWIPSCWEDDVHQDDGVCVLLNKNYYTEFINVKKERLKNCPLREVE